MGLHPFHPDALRLTPHQLKWATIMGKEGYGASIRENHETARRKVIADAAWNLLTWMDDHLTTRVTT